MDRLPAPCLTCQTAAILTHGRCPDCYRERRRVKARDAYARNGRRSRPEREKQRGAWQRLSQRARAAQPFCTDCGRSEAVLEAHERLEADHTPSAWHRVLSGKPIRLSDIEIVCSPCNRARGEALPGSARYAAWLDSESEVPA